MKFVPRSETTRKFITEATADLFNKKGYAGTSVADLEKATGLTKGSIYGNFENKEDVALAAFDYNLDRLRKLIQDTVDKCDTCREKLLGHIAVYYVKTTNNGGCPMLNTAVEADDTNETFRLRAASGLMLWKSDLVDIIKKGMAEKEFKADTDADKTALVIIALIEGGILLGKATKNFVHMDTVFDAAKNTIREICV